MCYNAVNTIERCIRSVISQQHTNIEYIIVDGGSTDGTLDVLSRYEKNISILISEPDKGIYDAMNKGIQLSSGEILGVLNADDFFANGKILTVVHEAFSSQPAYIVYGDLDYVDATGNTIRKWRSGNYKHGLFNYGWMPPHPTFYCRRVLFEQLGNYSLAYGTAADYELMSRFMHLNRTHAYYVPMVMVKMTTGGVSNRSLSNRVKALMFDLKAMRANNISLPIMAFIIKPLRKLKQFL